MQLRLGFVWGEESRLGGHWIRQQFDVNVSTCSQSFNRESFVALVTLLNTTWNSLHFSLLLSQPWTSSRWRLKPWIWSHRPMVAPSSSASFNSARTSKHAKRLSPMTPPAKRMEPTLTQSSATRTSSAASCAHSAAFPRALPVASNFTDQIQQISLNAFIPQICLAGAQQNV